MMSDMLLEPLAILNLSLSLGFSLELLFSPSFSLGLGATQKNSQPFQRFI